MSSKKKKLNLSTLIQTVQQCVQATSHKSGFYVLTAYIWSYNMSVLLLIAAWLYWGSTATIGMPLNINKQIKHHPDNMIHWTSGTSMPTVTKVTSHFSYSVSGVTRRVCHNKVTFRLQSNSVYSLIFQSSLLLLDLLFKCFFSLKWDYLRLRC